MENLLKKAGFGLLFLVAVLVLLNVLFIMPYLGIKPVQIPSGQEEVAERVKPAAVMPRVDSLQVIREDKSGEEAGYTELDVKALRNPFFWPEEKPKQEKVKEPAAVNKPAVVKPAAVKPAAGKPESEKPQLSMVLISSGRKQALLDDVFISEGDMFHGYRVKSIRDNEVILSGTFGDLHIILGTGEEKEKQTPTPGGIIEK
jgi:hypothetical protein